MEKKLKKSEDEILSMVRQSIRLARRYTDDVEFSPEDAGRTGADFSAAWWSTPSRCGATTINIPDTVGYTTPEQFGRSSTPCSTGFRTLTRR